MLRTSRRLRAALSLLPLFFAFALPAQTSSAPAFTAESFESHGVMRTQKLFELADAGDPAAQYFLGLRYKYATNGLALDLAQADQLFQKVLPVVRSAAEKGDPFNQNLLSTMYQVGLGVPANTEQAVFWVKKSADQGYGPALGAMASLYEVGKGVPIDLDRARLLWQKAGASEDPQAMSMLGNTYAYGSPAIPKDEEKARFWFLKAAEKGDRGSEFALGVMYRIGQGVAADPVTAIQWFRKAADAGNMTAVRYLGEYYYQGIGVPQDYARAYNSFVLPASDGDYEAQEFIGEMYRDGHGVKQDYAQARKWFELAAKVDTETGPKLLANLSALEAAATPEAQRPLRAPPTAGSSLATSSVIAHAKYYTYYKMEDDEHTDGEGVKGAIETVKWHKKQGLVDSQAAVSVILCALDARLGKDDRRTQPSVSVALGWSKIALEDINAEDQKFHPIKFDPMASGGFEQNRLAFIGYRFLGQGEPAIPANPEVAETWLLRAAEYASGDGPLSRKFGNGTGDPGDVILGNRGVDAQYNLGLAYLKGDVLPADAAKGFKWLKEAAANRDSHATVLLGLLYKEGVVVPQDNALGDELLNAAPWLYAREQAGIKNFEAAVASGRAASSALQAQLAQIRQQGHQDMLNAAVSGFSGAFPDAAATPSIQAATNQQMVQLASKEQQIEASKRFQQAMTRVNQTQPSPQRTYVAQPTPAPRTQVAQVAPPQPLQRTTSTQGMQVCPASGFVPGPGHYAACDAYVGERLSCTPGQSVPISTQSAPPSGCGTPKNASTPTSVVSASPTDGPPETGCIQLSSDPTNTYPVFHNTCSFPVKYFWTPFTIPPGGYAEQNGILQPGETQKGEETAVGGYRVYACQTNYLIRGPDGRPITGVVNGFRCVKP